MNLLARIPEFSHEPDEGCQVCGRHLVGGGAPHGQRVDGEVVMVVVLLALTGTRGGRRRRQEAAEERGRGLLVARYQAGAHGEGNPLMGGNDSNILVGVSQRSKLTVNYLVLESAIPLVLMASIMPSMCALV